jgi:hypothetical protein
MGGLGTLRSHVKVWAVPILHPAFILRGRFADEPAQVLYLKRARELLANPGSAAGGSVPVAPVRPTLVDLHQWEAGLVASGGGCAVDIETAGDHLRCVGMAWLAEPYTPLVVPVRTQGGDLYWSPSDFRDMLVWLWGILADESLQKVFHNGQAFDVPMLEHWGFTVRGYEFDTMLAQHVCYPGMDKGLEFMAKMYLGSPGWKHMVRGETDGEGK